MWLYIIFTVVIGLLLYKLVSTESQGYWSKYGVREIDTSKFASKIDMLLGRKSVSDVDTYVYKHPGQDKFVGVMEMGTPTIVLKDLDVIKKVYIKDFNYFVDRRQFLNETDGVAHKMLIALNGDHWKGVRSSVSPTFTTGKIRRMMGIFNEVGKEWVEVLKEKTKEGSGKFPALKIVNQFTTDVIGSAVFGINAGAIQNPDSVFATNANKMTAFSKFQQMKFAFRIGFPNLGKKLGITFADPKLLEFFEKILAQGLKERMNGGVWRNDFLQLMVDAKKGELKAEGSDELSQFEKDAQITGVKGQYLTEEVMNALSFLFFFAGSASMASTITMAAYCLALNQDVQTKLREELDTVVKEDGTFDYDELGHLVYLDMVISEVIRKFPGAARLERLCVKDYKDDETGLIIPKGTIVTIPIIAIHNDKRFYDNPDKFDPEHFTAEKRAQRHSAAYIPFGLGPRNCLGMRFAVVEVQAAVAHLVHSFLIEPTEKTPDPPRAKYAGFGLGPPDDLELKLTSLY